MRMKSILPNSIEMIEWFFITWIKNCTNSTERGHFVWYNSVEKSCNSELYSSLVADFPNVKNEKNWLVFLAVERKARKSIWHSTDRQVMSYEAMRLFSNYWLGDEFNDFCIAIFDFKRIVRFHLNYQ